MQKTLDGGDATERPHWAAGIPMVARDDVASATKRPLRISLVTGSYPPEPCGVGDYAYQLAAILRKRGVEVHIVTGGCWSLKASREVVRRIRATSPDIIHIQYPTIGYGNGLVPQLLPSVTGRIPVLLTLHEFSQAHFLRKIAIMPFTVGRSEFVFTTDFERVACSRWFPWLRSKSSVIPIGSNIPYRDSGERDPHLVVYFGLIRPNKGLEEFLSLADASRQHALPFRFEVLGNPDLRHASYFETLRRAAESLPIHWVSGLDSDGVSLRLSRATYAYLPFPDGASDRRGSLLAAMGNRLATITTHGQQTPAKLLDAVRIAATPDAAMRHLMALYHDPAQRADLVEKAGNYARRFAWDPIALAHVACYEHLLRSQHRGSK